MRFWGDIAADGSAITIQGVRLAAGDENLQPAIIPAQNYIGGRLLRENGNVSIEVGSRRVRTTVDRHNFAGFFEEKGDAAGCAGRQVHVRYVEESQGGRALAIVVTTTLPQTCRPPSPPSGATPEQVRQTFAEIEHIHARFRAELRADDASDDERDTRAGKGW